MIKAEGISYHYEGGLSPFNLEVSFQIKAEEFILVLGENGCGKSTLFSLLEGFIEPQEGRLLIQGQDGRFLAPSERDMGVIFQEHNLFSHLTVEENLSFVNPHPKALEEILLKFDIPRLLKQKVSTLSGGQIQKVTLARTLLQAKKILIMDEPLSALDPSSRKMALDTIYEEHQRKHLTLLLSTHFPCEASSLASRIIFLSEGKIFYDGSPAGFFNSTLWPVRKYLEIHQQSKF